MTKPIAAIASRRFRRKPASAWPVQYLSALVSSNGRWFSRRVQNRACGVPHGSAALHFFQPASELWRQPLVHTKTTPVPADDGFGRDQDEGLLPIRPGPPSDYPEELIEGAETRARCRREQRDKANKELLQWLALLEMCIPAQKPYTLHRGEGPRENSRSRVPRSNSNYQSAERDCRVAVLPYRE